MTTWSEAEGSPQPPGATWLEKEKSYNFSLYSRHATGVTLLLYSARDLVNPVLRVTPDGCRLGPVAVANQVMRCFAPGKRVNHLTCDPLGAISKY